MRIRMKTQVSGSRNGVPWPPRGGVLDVPDDEGAELCASGVSVPVADEADDSVETATVPDDAETGGAEESGADVEKATPPDDTEKRALTTETAAAVTPNVKAATPRKAPAKKTTAAKKTAAPAKSAQE